MEHACSKCLGRGEIILRPAIKITNHINGSLKSSIKYVSSDRGRGGPAKSVLACMGVRGRLSCHKLFSQVRYKIEIQ